MDALASLTQGSPADKLRTACVAQLGVALLVSIWQVCQAAAACSWRAPSRQALMVGGGCAGRLQCSCGRAGPSGSVTQPQ